MHLGSTFFTMNTTAERYEQELPIVLVIISLKIQQRLQIINKIKTLNQLVVIPCTSLEYLIYFFQNGKDKDNDRLAK